MARRGGHAKRSPPQSYPVGTILRKQFDVGGAFYAGEVLEVGQIR
jgi:hypothetical protein